ncbi:hypothetical protein [Botrimarina sp.]|uniref:hypothetical protein n=1 Tax=Botrimarina sp. TaxID=2795802 RepID=UPI0032EE5E75
MRRGVDDGEEIPGGDSFLDVVANIVGILVLLVVVVGVRAGREAFTPRVEIPASPNERLAETESEIERLARRIGEHERDVSDLRSQVRSVATDAQNREHVREAGALYVTKLRAELDDARAALSEGDREKLDVHTALAQAGRRLDELEAQRIALATVEPEPEVETVEISPTPIVDGRATDTVSFRLKGKRLVYVPLDEITNELKSKLQPPTITNPSRPVTTRHKVGPLEGFGGEAEIAWSVQAVGPRVGIQVTLSQMVLREVVPLRGESLEEAFSPTGQTRSRLELLDPKEHVVRLIVYADSFESAPEVSQRFRDEGFRVAQSLKSDGSPIGFSSNGHDAVTQ